jgi:curved DNA-binding protein CbpA
MAPDADPYRTLGLSRDATLDEVRRAYRRLAKANHPDAAGEAALPRFLAIQAAYDMIAGPEARGRRPGPARPTAPRRAWDADSERTDATYRAYGGRARRTRPSTASASGRGPSAAGERPAGASRPPRAERPSNKATLGSTSYDGADAEPFEPDWGGASWYGTTSGTYWTLNPKEYADPRKHGPEYQARARRKLGGRDEAEGTEPGIGRPPSDEVPAEDPGDVPGAADAASGQAEAPAEPSIGRATRPPTHTTSSWWEATVGEPARSETSASAGPRTGPRARGRAAPTESRSRARGAPAPSRPPAYAAATDPPPVRPEVRGPLTSSGLGSDAILDAVRTWLDDTSPGAIARVGRAVLGWAPIALGIGWLSGELSGCGRFAAGCDDTAVMSAWVAQIVALVVLLLVGRFARIASLATLTTLAAAIPAALLLSATGGPDAAAAGRMVLSGLLAIAWAVGLVLGITREVRGTLRGPGPPGVSGSAGPVS